MNTENNLEFSDTDRQYTRLKGQAEILYSQSAITFLFPVIFAGLLTILLWELSNRAILISWFAIITSYTFFRYSVLWSYKKSGDNLALTQKWLDRFIIAACLSGVMWGAAGIILVPYDTDKIIEFTLYNGLTMLTVCGLVAGAVISYCVSMIVVLFYSFPALIPPALYLISLGDKHNSALGGFIILYFVFIVMAAYRMNRQLMYYLYKDYAYNHLLKEYKKSQDKPGAPS